MTGFARKDFVEYKGRVYLVLYVGTYQGRKVVQLRFLRGDKKKFWATVPELCIRCEPPKNKKLMREVARL